MMPEIYMAAETVYVWLGKGTDESAFAIDILAHDSHSGLPLATVLEESYDSYLKI